MYASGTPLSSPLFLNSLEQGGIRVCASSSPLPSPSTGPTQVMVLLGGSSLVPYPPVEPLVEPSVVEVVVVDTRVECFSVVAVVAPSGPAVPVSTNVAHFLRVFSGAEPLATLQVGAHVECLPLPAHPFLYR